MTIVITYNIIPHMVYIVLYREQGRNGNRPRCYKNLTFRETLLGGIGNNISKNLPVLA